MDQDLLCIPHAPTKKYGQRAFAFMAAKLCNERPLNIKKSSSLNYFKSGLKTILFKQAYLL